MKPLTVFWEERVDQPQKQQSVVGGVDLTMRFYAYLELFGVIIPDTVYHESLTPQHVTTRSQVNWA